MLNDEAATALLNSLGGLFGVGSKLELRSGSSVLATIELPEHPWGDVANRSKDVLGGWSGVASADGEIDNYRLVSAGGQYVDTGSVTKPDGGGDMRLDNTNVARGQSLFINSFRKEM